MTPKDQTYRSVLERLDAAFPGREALTKLEVANFLGVHPNTISRRYGWPRGLILKETVARALSGYDDAH